MHSNLKRARLAIIASDKVDCKLQSLQETKNIRIHTEHQNI